MKRWLEEPDSTDREIRSAQNLLARADSPRPSPEARVRVAARLSRSRTAAPFPILRLSIAGALVGAVLVMFVLQLREPKVERVAEVIAASGEVNIEGTRARTGRDGALSLDARGVKIALHADTVLELDELIRLDHGGVEIETTKPIALVAGPFRISTKAAQFTAVVVEKTKLTISVASGSVAIEGEGELVAGETRTLPETEEQLYNRARDTKDAARAIALYDRVAKMRGSYAEIAAYQAASATMKLGDNERAIERFEKLRGGAYAQEASLSTIECRIALKDFARAAKELETFLASYPESARAPELKKVLADLKREDRMKVK